MDHHKELRLWGMDGRVSAKLDGVLTHEKRALVYDWKTGPEGAESASQNLQLRVQAVLVKEKWPHLLQIAVAIIAPRAGTPMSLAVYDKNDLTQARTELAEKLERLEMDNPPRTPSAAACKWCRAQSECEEFQGTRLQLIESDPREVSAAELPRLLELAELAERAVASRASEIRQAARTLLAESPEAIDGWELAPGMKRRKISDVNRAYAALADYGIEFGTIMAGVTISPSAIEKAYATARELKLRDAKERVAEALGELVETAEGEPRLKRKR